MVDFGLTGLVVLFSFVGFIVGFLVTDVEIRVLSFSSTGFAGAFFDEDVAVVVVEVLVGIRLAVVASVLVNLEV